MKGTRRGGRHMDKDRDGVKVRGKERVEEIKRKD